MPLHAVRPADHQDCIVQHLQHTFHLGREIHVSRCVEKRKLHVFPLHDCLLGEDRNAAFSLHFVRVQECIAVIDPPQSADTAA